MSIELEPRIREAIIGELKRQAEISDGRLAVEESGDGVTVNGPLDIDALTMVVLGEVAGGP